MPIVTTSSNRRPKRVPAFPLIVIAAVIVAGFAVYLTKSEHTQKEQPQVPDTAVRPVTDITPPAHITEPEPDRPIDLNPPSDTTTLEEPEEDSSKVRKGSKNGYYIMPDGKEHKFKLPPEGKTISMKFGGVLYRFDSEGNYVDISAPKPFDNPIENQLVGFSVEGGSFAPGLLLRHSDEEIMEALRKPVVINDDDSEQIKAKKQAVAEMKGVILDYIEQGGTYEQFVTDVAMFTKKERAAKKEGIRQLVALVREDRLEEARAFRSQLGKLLEEQGFSPLKLPIGLAEKLGETEPPTMDAAAAPEEVE